MAASPTRPPAYYVYRSGSGSFGLLAQTRPDLTEARLSPSRQVKYRTRDGAEIPAILTLPRGHTGGPLPLLVIPNGQLLDQSYLAWSAELQLFASRGFAVLQPNARGSVGDGIAHMMAGRRQWGRRNSEDIEDGVAWLVAEGIADPERVGIFGHGYGAYHALMGAVKTPELYRAVAGYGGVYDLEEKVDNDQWYSFWSDEWHEHLIGDDEQVMRRYSPLRRAKEIKVPVLLGHGADDPGAHVNQSRDMAKALERAKRPVAYLEFKDETDQFLMETNRLAFYSRLAEFFEEHLGRPTGSAPVARPSEQE